MRDGYCGGGFSFSQERNGFPTFNKQGLDVFGFFYTVICLLKIR